jgi:hypothetical protein
VTWPWEVVERDHDIQNPIAASEDDWDRYESLHWRAIEEWLAQHPGEDFRAQHERHRGDYLRFQRALLGWAIFVGRKNWG